MKNIYFFLLFAIGFLSGCCSIPDSASDSALNDITYRPLVLEFDMYGGTVFDPCYKISSRFGKVFYYKYTMKDIIRDPKNTDPIIIRPTVEQWIDFTNKIHSLKACNWKKKYEPPYTVHDGTHWIITIIFDGKTKRTDIISSGHNAYPDGFEELIKCLDGLTGTTDLFDDMFKPVDEDDENIPDVFRSP